MTFNYMKIGTAHFRGFSDKCGGRALWIIQGSKACAGNGHRNGSRVWIGRDR